MLVGEEVRRLCAEGKVVCPQYLLDQLEEIGWVNHLSYIHT